VTYLDETYPKLKDKIISQDFLRYTIMKFLRGSSSLSLGILQYFDTNCFRTLEYRDQIPEFAGMFQKRVAQRICEKKGLKRGILSVLVQAFMMQNIFYGR
jgi:16S rRNA (adenine1518-N6/adenine1519-N6)-dimethyltransferase